MYKKLLVNIGSGYLFKVLQVISGLVTVPLLVSERGLGLAGYGQLMAALSWVSLLSMLLDGFRLIASKKMGENKSFIIQELFSLSVVFILVISVMTAPLMMYSSEVTELLSIYGDGGFLTCLLLFFICEQFLYLLEQYFHCYYKTFIVNALNSIESIFRLILIIYAFRFNNGTQLDYVYIFLGTYLAKAIIYAIVIASENSVKNIQLFSLYKFSNYANEAIPLSFKGMVNFLVFRLSVIYANKFLSPESASVFSIIFVTLRGYLAQIFVTVIRPMIIPLLSGISFADDSPEKIQRLISLITLFELVSLVCISVFAATTPLWLGLWLDVSFQKYSALFAIGMWMSAIEVAYSIKSLVLISQGSGNRLARVSLIVCAFYFAMFYFFYRAHSTNLEHLVFIVVMYIALYNGLTVTYLFHRYVNKSIKPLASSMLFMCFSLADYYVMVADLINAQSIYYSCLLVSSMILALIFMNNYELKCSIKSIRAIVA